MITVELTQGSTTSIVLELTDQDGKPEILQGLADKAVLDVRDGSTLILHRDTVALNLTIAGGTLVMSLTGVESNALPVGTYVAQALVRYGDDNHWYETPEFLFRVLKPTAVKI